MNTQLTWLGHAALALTMGGKKVLVDPYLTENPLAAARAGDLEAEFILITHGHHDHIGDSLAIAGRTGAVIVGTPGVIGWLKKQGAQNTKEQTIGDAEEYPFGRLQLTKAVHGENLPDGSSGGPTAGLLLADHEGKNIYIAGDTFLFDEMAQIGGSGLALAVLPIGGKYTMDPGEALQAVQMLKPEFALPYHYNTWDVIRQDPEGWKRDVEAATPTKVALLKPGESLEI